MRKGFDLAAPVAFGALAGNLLSYFGLESCEGFFITAGAVSEAVGVGDAADLVGIHLSVSGSFR